MSAATPKHPASANGNHGGNSTTVSATATPTMTHSIVSAPKKLGWFIHRAYTDQLDTPHLRGA